MNKSVKHCKQEENVSRLQKKDRSARKLLIKLAVETASLTSDYNYTLLTSADLSHDMIN